MVDSEDPSSSGWSLINEDTVDAVNIVEVSAALRLVNVVVKDIIGNCDVGDDVVVGDVIVVDDIIVVCDVIVDVSVVDDVIVGSGKHKLASEFISLSTYSNRVKLPSDILVCSTSLRKRS